jgi:hypothetical protein
MKLAILFSIGLLSVTQLVAQDDNVRKLQNYPRNSSITITDKHCIISSDKQLDSFAIIKDANNILHAKVKADYDKIKLFQFTEVQLADLKMQYDTLQNKKYIGLPLIEQLMNRASDKGGTIKFVNDKTNVPNSNAPESSLNENEVPIANDETDLLPKENKNSDVLLYSLAGLLAIISGLLIREKLKNKKEEKLDSKVNTTTATPKEIADANQQIVQLQKTNSSLLAQLRELELQFKTYKDSDNAYFENALSMLVNPAKSALTKQQKAETLSLAMQILVQYIAITHAKTDRRQGSDDYNVKTMKGETLSMQEAKQIVIAANTPSDAIPNELKTIIQILKDNDVELPSNLCYMGYKIL